MSCLKKRRGLYQKLERIVSEVGGRRVAHSQNDFFIVVVHILHTIYVYHDCFSLSLFSSRIMYIEQWGEGRAPCLQLGESSEGRVDLWMKESNSKGTKKRERCSEERERYSEGRERGRMNPSGTDAQLLQ